MENLTNRIITNIIYGLSIFSVMTFLNNPKLRSSILIYILLATIIGFSIDLVLTKRIMEIPLLRYGLPLLIMNAVIFFFNYFFSESRDYLTTASYWTNMIILNILTLSIALYLTHRNKLLYARKLEEKIKMVDSNN